ncbi:hypothetical protein ACWGRF_20020 [Streptomyces zhihengii]
MTEWLAVFAVTVEAGSASALSGSLAQRATNPVEHALTRMKAWSSVRDRRFEDDCRRKDEGVHRAMFGIARLHNLASSG